MSERESPERNNPAIERVRAVDRALAARGVPSEASERVRRALQRQALQAPMHTRLRWWPVLAFAAGAALMAIGLRSLGDAPADDDSIAIEAPVVEVPKQPELDSPAPVESPEPAHCLAFERGTIELAAGDCLEGEGVRLSALLDSSIAREGAVIEVHGGELLFDVAPRPDDPLHVHAGSVDIEVVGTRFVVHREAGEAGTGWVSMLEGQVRVHGGDAAARELAAGQRLDWPTAREPTAQPGNQDKTAGDGGESAADEGLSDLLDEVAKLRRAGEFAEAVERLRGADTRAWSRRARQLVSYEIGTLLERQLQDDDAACAHWAAHREQFPDGRHDAIVARSMERLGCSR